MTNAIASDTLPRPAKILLLVCAAIDRLAAAGAITLEYPLLTPEGQDYYTDVAAEHLPLTLLEVAHAVHTLQEFGIIDASPKDLTSVIGAIHQRII